MSNSGDNPLHNSPQESLLRRFAPLVGMLCGVAMVGGCRGRAYNDVYLENMAAEMRDMEDQLYEYDYAYRALEQENDELAGELDTLRRGSSYYGSEEDVQPLRVSPEVEGPTPAEVPPGANSIMEPDSAQSEPVRSLPVSPRQAPSTFPQSDPNNQNTLPPPPGNNSTEFGAEELLPPTIEFGDPAPPALPVSQYNSASAAPDNSLELNLSRIEVPTQLVSDVHGENSEDGRDALELPAQDSQVTDTRVVEMGFHPSLSRAMSFDDRNDDDGVYLVLQPKNALGQMVPAAAALSVVILDPARESDRARIGRLDYGEEEVRSMMKPIGTSQGIHLSLKWDSAPQADQVLVFARYRFTDGRQVIGDKTFFVSSDSGLRTVWGPRATTEVLQASYEDRDRSNSFGVNTLRPPAPSQFGERKVVRPSSSRLSSDPAPSPLNR